VVVASDAADEHSSADAVRRRSRARGSPKPPPPELRRSSQTPELAAMGTRACQFPRTGGLLDEDA